VFEGFIGKASDLRPVSPHERFGTPLDLYAVSPRLFRRFCDNTNDPVYHTFIMLARSVVEWAASPIAVLGSLRNRKTRKVVKPRSTGFFVNERRSCDHHVFLGALFHIGAVAQFDDRSLGSSKLPAAEALAIDLDIVNGIPAKKIPTHMRGFMMSREQI